MENNKKNSSEVIKAFIRIRPPISNEINNEICLYTTLNKNILLKTEKYNITCNYDYIFNELSTQEEVFQHINSLLDDVLYGYNACIFAYGQTSAGKVLSFFLFFISYYYYLIVILLIILIIIIIDSYYAWSKWWTRF